MTGRVLITGVSGFAGRLLAERLLAEGWTVAGTAHTRSADVDGLDEHRLELGDREGLTELVRDFQPEVVYHLAAIVDTVTTPDVVALYRTNTLGTAVLLEALGGVESVRRVLIASSAFVYGRTPVRATAGPRSHATRARNALRCLEGG